MAQLGEVTTLPRLLQVNARERGGRPAIREKDRGIWQTHTWREYHDHVRDFALGLAALGFRRGEALSVIGDNRPRLYWAQLAAQALGGVAVPVYQDSIARELSYVWGHAEAVVIVAEDQEQVDKIVSLRDQLPKLRHVIYDDPRGLTRSRFDWLKSFEEVQELGRKHGGQHPGLFEAEIDRGRPEDVAMICYTSGTTGNPKGAMLTHANVVSTARTFMSAEDVRADDEWLCYLPMAWVGDSLYSLVLSLAAGFCCNCRRARRRCSATCASSGPPRCWPPRASGRTC
jgi:long-chain acyl-CoA synthetase